MKKLLSHLLLGLCLCYGGMVAQAEDKVLNVYSWGGYIPESILQQFKAKTGITVRYTEYNSNESMYAKLKSNPNVGYDIIIPSSYYVEKMRREGMLHPIDHTRVTIWPFVSALFRNSDYDPNNRYSVPLVWGATGILINTRYVDPDKVHSWKDFWNPNYRDQLLLIDDMRENFSMALIALGYSPNDTNKDHIYQAYLKLKALMPNVRVFNAGNTDSLFGDDDIHIGMAWNTDSYRAYQMNARLKFIYPSSGYVIWIDCLAIPQWAKHLDNAYAFINFLYQPRILSQISKHVGGPNCSDQAMALLPKAMLASPMMNPPKSILKRATVQGDVGQALSTYMHYWQLLKLS